MPRSSRLLAAMLLAALPADAWDPATLTAPIYARPPAVTAPRQRVPA